MQNFKNLLLFLVAVSHMLFFSSCEEETDTPQGTSDDITISTSDHYTLGNLLVDQDGRTLYILTRDINGTSACLDGCAESWPAFFAEETIPATGLSAEDFGTITREDGQQQTTYKGWPLYYFSGDDQPGDTNGEGLGDVWFVAKPDYTIMLAEQAVAGIDQTSTKYLVDPQGRTLYYFLNDEENISNCSGGCLEAWPAFEDTENLIIPSFLENSKFSVIEREDGKQQLAYLGRAMYFFFQDDTRGETNGHDVNNFTLSRYEWD